MTSMGAFSTNPLIFHSFFFLSFQITEIFGRDVVGNKERSERRQNDHSLEESVRFALWKIQRGVRRYQTMQQNS